MDCYPYTSSHATPTYLPHASTSGTNSFDNIHLINRDQLYTDPYERPMPNLLPAVLHTATITTNTPPTPIATARVQQFSYRPSASNSRYDTPRSYDETIASGYVSDTNDLRRSSISVRPMNGTLANTRQTINQPAYLKPLTPTYNTKLSANNEQNYFSDSECVTAGPRYYKIARQVNTTNRRTNNIVLPIRSITSKAYNPYIPTEPPKPEPSPPPQQQQLFDVYRYQQEQQRLERQREPEYERQEYKQRQFYQKQQQTVNARFHPPPKLNLLSRTTIDPELGAELIKSPNTNSKSFSYSDYPE